MIQILSLPTQITSSIYGLKVNIHQCQFHDDLGIREHLDVEES